MNPDLHDNVWMQRGTSLLWDAEALNCICSAESVRSLRDFLCLCQAGWPEDALELINNRTIVVAGLESAMDTLHPEHAVEWLEGMVYPAVRDFQENVAGGGSEAALIFWLADRNRVFHNTSENSYHWHCSGEHRTHSIPLGRCIWNGAEGSVRRIITVKADKKEVWTGLFHPRIS
jgi:hypothetical protein